MSVSLYQKISLTKRPTWLSLTWKPIEASWSETANTFKSNRMSVYQKISLTADLTSFYIEVSVLRMQ